MLLETVGKSESASIPKSSRLGRLIRPIGRSANLGHPSFGRFFCVLSLTMLVVPLGRIKGGMLELETERKKKRKTEKEKK